MEFKPKENANNKFGRNKRGYTEKSLSEVGGTGYVKVEEEEVARQIKKETKRRRNKTRHLDTRKTSSGFCGYDFFLGRRHVTEKFSMSDSEKVFSFFRL